MPAGHHAAQCMDMLCDGRVKPWWGRASRTGQVRNGRARRTARNTPELGASLPWGVSAKGILCASDQGERSPMAVTTQGIQTVDTRVDTEQCNVLGGWRMLLGTCP